MLWLAVALCALVVSPTTRAVRPAARRAPLAHQLATAPLAAAASARMCADDDLATADTKAFQVTLVDPEDGKKIECSMLETAEVRGRLSRRTYPTPGYAHSCMHAAARSALRYRALASARHARPALLPLGARKAVRLDATARHARAHREARRQGGLPG